MKTIEKTIDDLCSHEISKEEALCYLKSIFNSQRGRNALEFNVDYVGFTISGNVELKLSLLNGYDKVNELLSKGDKVDVSIVY